MIKPLSFITYNMISLKNIRENRELISKQLESKNFEIVKIDEVLDLDKKWREGVSEVEKLKEQRNSASKKISIYKKEKKPSDSIIEEMQAVSSKIKEIDIKNIDLKTKIDALLLDFPNTPHKSVPPGVDESSNKVVRIWGEKPSFDFNIQSHVSLGESLRLLDFKAGSKISGSGFLVYINLHHW